MAPKEYNASSLRSTKGLEHVRLRPGMYIGSTDTTGLHHLVWEAVDNAVDEANEGYGKHIYITINSDGSITIQDEGRGVPYDYNAKEKKYGFELVYLTLNAGGKFDDQNYKAAGGLHGVGASVITALSEWIEIHSYREGIDHYMTIYYGGTKATKLFEKPSNEKRGTKITFLPDKKIFSDTKFDYNRIANRIDDAACLTKGVTFHLKDERTGRKQDFCYSDGLVEYFKKHTEGRTELAEIVRFEGIDNEIKAEVAFQYFKGDYAEKIYSFANGVRTTEGGHHVAGFKKALTIAFNNFASNHNLIKKNQKLEGDDIREGMTCIISCTVPENKLQFEGQTKSKLGTKEAAPAVENIVETRLSYYLEEHAQFAETIIKKTLEAMSVRQKTKDVRDAERKKIATGAKGSMSLSGKLSPASSKSYSENELFIVEGDSAGGSAKKCRDREHQAILPLRGKPKNVTSTTNDEDILDNKELYTLISTIGAGFNDDFNIKNIRYGKIIIMTDADDDGSHIQNLLLSFFYTHMRQLILNGHIYIACPPLYLCAKGSNEIYCWDDKELDEARKKLGNGYRISRYKGLGEMDASQLGKTTMNKATRRLIQVKIDDEDECTDKVDLFLGNDAERRKEWISTRIDFKGEKDHLMEVKDEK
ncbi:MAG TPA: DNA topoisomerase IV subunit B [Firmicutes bacterium]|nr:DNA topoisomerase IV subunit B [Bacillota bacterium]